MSYRPTKSAFMLVKEKGGEKKSGAGYPIMRPGTFVLAIDKCPEEFFWRASFF